MARGELAATLQLLHLLLLKLALQPEVVACCCLRDTATPASKRGMPSHCEATACRATLLLRAGLLYSMLSLLLRTTGAATTTCMLLLLESRATTRFMRGGPRPERKTTEEESRTSLT